MKPAYFEYFKATTVEEAISWLESFGEDAKILAGGQSLIPMMNLRLASPKQLIDIKGIASIATIEEMNSSLKIGALVSHCEVQDSEIIKKSCPILSKAAGLIGHPQIRYRGTIGGSICHADPCAEIPTALIALDAGVIVRGPQGSERRIESGLLFLGYLTTSIGENEILSEVIVPKLPERTGWEFMEITDVDGGTAIVCVAAILDMDAKGLCQQAKIAIGGVAPTPIRAKEVEQSLQGKSINDKDIDTVAEMISDVIEPETDITHTADYKATCAKALVKRALKAALERR